MSHKPGNIDGCKVKDFFPSWSPKGLDAFRATYALYQCMGYYTKLDELKRIVRNAGGAANVAGNSGAPSVFINLLVSLSQAGLHSSIEDLFVGSGGTTTDGGTLPNHYSGSKPTGSTDFYYMASSPIVQPVIQQWQSLVNAPNMSQEDKLRQFVLSSGNSIKAMIQQITIQYPMRDGQVKADEGRVQAEIRQHRVGGAGGGGGKKRKHKHKKRKGSKK